MIRSNAQSTKEIPMANTLLKDTTEDDRNRATRAQTSREAEVIHEPSGNDDWVPKMMTNAPDPRPGYVQRWVRTSILGTEDVSNFMKKKNEGWSPRSADTIPNGFFAPTIDHARYGNVISNGDMILMERPTQVNERQKAFIDTLTSNQTSGIEKYLSQAMPGGNGFSAGQVEKFDRQVTTGRRPKIADD
jgi:hypothetical protein